MQRGRRQYDTETSRLMTSSCDDVSRCVSSVSLAPGFLFDASHCLRLFVHVRIVNRLLLPTASSFHCTNFAFFVESALPSDRSLFVSSWLFLNQCLVCWTAVLAGCLWPRQAPAVFLSQFYPSVSDRGRRVLENGQFGSSSKVG